LDFWFENIPSGNFDMDATNATITATVDGLSVCLLLLSRVGESLPEVVILPCTYNLLVRLRKAFAICNLCKKNVKFLNIFGTVPIFLINNNNNSQTAQKTRK
jgi:hypothetical protein